MNVNWAVFTAFISVLTGLSGVILGWSARAREQRRETKQEAKTEMELKMDVEYIKRGIDDVRIEVRSHGQRMDSMAERLTRVEESAKQAHKRIDRLEEKEV